MGLHSEAWLNGLGDEWLERNRPYLGSRTDDLLLDFIVDNNFPVGKVYEIGCSNGWRLKILKDLGWDVWGLDPSEKAVRESVTILGTHRVSWGTADHSIAIARDSDVVILGFCMCLVDPIDWPKVVGEVDRVLKTGGHLLIHDMAMEAPSATIERHNVNFDGAKKYTGFPMCVMYWPKLWNSFPSYRLIAEAKVPGRKDICFAFKKDEYWHEA